MHMPISKRADEKVPVIRVVGHINSMRFRPRKQMETYPQTCTGVAPQRWRSDHTYTNSFGYKAAAALLLAHMSSNHTCVH